MDNIVTLFHKINKQSENILIFEKANNQDMPTYTNQQLIDCVLASNGIDNDAKAQLVQLLKKDKKYGLVWEDKPEDTELRLVSEIPVLKEDASMHVSPMTEKTTVERPEHILIEGDNLEALISLTYTHEGKVDIIYIDPPYNTGNNDFIYNDNIVDKEDQYRHSKWLSFMAKRLRIAKKLLSEKGAIFISIDDNEQSTLKLLCDEIFGHDAFLGNIIWEKSDSPRMDVSGFSVRHDYILVYGMHSFELKRLPVDNIPDHYNRVDEKGRRYYTKPMRIMGGHISESLFYPLIAPDGSEVYPYDKNGNKSGWRWSKAKVIEEGGRIDWVNGKNGWNPYFRIYADNMKDMPVETIWTFDKVGSNRTAKNTLNEILGDNAFSYPKPTTLIKQILRIAGGKDITVLDFFAGSGTTLHATMQLNAEDGGNRKCILVTNNENGICEAVTYERNKRVITGYTTPKGTSIPGLENNNLRYFRTVSVPRENTHQNKKAIVTSAIDLIRIKENCFNESKYFGSLHLINKEALLRYFEDHDHKVLIILDSRVIPYVVKEIESLSLSKDELKIYIFADGSYPYTEDFSAVLERVQLVALPYSIIQSIKSVIPEEIDIEIDNSNLTESEKGLIISAGE